MNALILVGIILIFKISIVHARSRAPAWSCLLATKLTGRKFVTTFHGTYNFGGKLKKFYNSIMVRSDLIIAGSNFIFSHIKQNYSKYLNDKKKLLVIFRGINVDYFDPTTKFESDEKKLLTKWNMEKDKKIINLDVGSNSFELSLRILGNEFVAIKIGSTNFSGKLIAGGILLLFFTLVLLEGFGLNEILIQ